MQSFDTKDSNTLESFDRKFENFDTFSTKYSEVKQSDNEFVESFDRKFEITYEEALPDSKSFDTKDSEMKQLDNEFVERFDRKFDISDEEALPDSASFGTKDAHVPIPKFDNFNANSDNSEQSSTLLKCACSGSEKSKADGRCKPRSQRQIEAYKRNFNARNPLELRINELDLRLRHLQSLVLSLLSR